MRLSLSGFSLRARLTFWVLVLLVVRGLVVLVLYYAFVRTAFRHLDAHVEEEVIELRNIARLPDPVPRWRQVVEVEARPDRKSFFSIRILDAAGGEAVVSGVFLEPEWRTRELGDSAEPYSMVATVAGTPETLRIYRFDLVDAADRHYTLHMAVDLHYLVRYGDDYNTTAGTAFLVATLVGVWFAWWITGRSLRPLQRLADRMQTVGLNRLDERVAEPKAHDEVHLLVRSFNSMLDRLQDSVERYRVFTADAAHELRTPVAAAYTTIEVALRQDRTADEYRQVLATLLPALDQLAVLGRDLGTLAEADAGQLRLDLKPTDMNEVASVTAEFLLPLAEEKGLTLTLKTAETGAAVTGDAGRLRQVMFNLLENAIKYTPEGSITVEVITDPAGVGASVHDTGPGIDPEHLDRLFDRFYRVDKDRSRRSGGSGLGLAICRSLVEAHGGTLAVTSMPGAGSTFTFRIPRKA